MPSLSINRPALEADFPAILAIWQEAMAVHAEIDPRFPLVPDADEKFLSYLHQISGDSDALVFVAETAGRVVAYCIARIGQHPPIFSKRSFGYINDLMVGADMRRQGIGTSLFSAVVLAFEKRGIHDLEVSFVPDNKMSSAFWQKRGFATRLVTARLESNAS